MEITKIWGKLQKKENFSYSYQNGGTKQKAMAVIQRAQQFNSSLRRYWATVAYTASQFP